MMKEIDQKLTLDRPATYQIKVPGHLGERWSEWAGGMTITVESEGGGPPVTTLTGTVADQALVFPDSKPLAKTVPKPDSLMTWISHPLLKAWIGGWPPSPDGPRCEWA